MVALPNLTDELNYPLASKPPSIRLLADESSQNPFGLTIAAAWS